ncbi:hypothetical protein [Carnobacterium divergens]|uniref:hypothetical protein n=1 Tax=Carnobacterium divergens TaxID=2748 RepID=UPI002892392B|nr:hypothetical protein [Carnobacterium divergens]MDT2011186.1 hypothetical protein [Carnobacterium divergens]
MADLKDLINVNINRDTISIQGKEIPVLFEIQSFAYVTEAYGKPYYVFENDLNSMLRDGKVELNEKELKLMSSLTYAMIRSGGTNCTVEEIRGGIPLKDWQTIFQKALDIFQSQDFQKEDLDRLKNDSKKK